MLFIGGPGILFQLMPEAKEREFLSNIENDDKVSRRVQTSYLNAVSSLVNIAKERAQTNTPLYLFGICMGYESVVMSQAGPKHRLNYLENNSKMHSLKINDFNTSIYKDREDYLDEFNYLIKYYFDYIKKRLGKIRTFFFHHNYGYTIKNFKSNPFLSDFEILTYSDSMVSQPCRNTFAQFYTRNRDKCYPPNMFECLDLRTSKKPICKILNNRVTTTDYSDRTDSFVTSIIHKKIPFLGVQFHPEKPDFDSKYNPSVSIDSITLDVNRLIGRFFVRNIFRKKVFCSLSYGDFTYFQFVRRFLLNYNECRFCDLDFFIHCLILQFEEELLNLLRREICIPILFWNKCLI